MICLFGISYFVITIALLLDHVVAKKRHLMKLKKSLLDSGMHPPPELWDSGIPPPPFCDSEKIPPPPLWDSGKIPPPHAGK